MASKKTGKTLPKEHKKPASKPEIKVDAIGVPESLEVEKEELLEWLGLGITEERLRQLAEKGMFPKADRGMYKFKETVRGLLHFYADVNQVTATATRRIKNEREQIELENAKIDQGKKLDALIDKAVAIRAVTRFVIRLKFLQFAIPRALALRLAVETAPDSCESLMTKSLRESYLKARDEFELGKPKFECPSCKKPMPI